MIMKKILIFLVGITFFFSCGPERVIKDNLIEQFFSDLNDGFVKEASASVTQESLSALYIFNERFLKHKGNMQFQVMDFQTSYDNGSSSYIVKLKITNMTNAAKKYFEEYLDDKSTMEVTLVSQLENDAEKIVFDWGVDGIGNLEEYQLIEATGDGIRIRKTPSTNGAIITKISHKDIVLGDVNYDNETWVKCLVIDNHGQCFTGYISKQFTSDSNEKFFD